MIGTRRSSWLIAACACLVLGCGGEPVAPSKPRPRGAINYADDPTPAPTPPPKVSYDTKLTGDVAPPPTAAAAADAPKAEEKKRDFGQELLGMMSGAISCLKPRAAEAALKHVDIALTANVTPSGAVSRGEASASALEPDELACVRRQIEALRFAAPIENAPFAVHATLAIDQAPPPPQPAAAAAPAADAVPGGAYPPSEPAPEAAPSTP